MGRDDTTRLKWSKSGNILGVGTMKMVKFKFKSLERAEPGNIWDINIKQLPISDQNYSEMKKLSIRTPLGRYLYVGNEYLDKLLGINKGHSLEKVMITNCLLRMGSLVNPITSACWVGNASFEAELNCSRWQRREGSCNVQ